MIIEGGYIHNQDDDGGVHSMVDQEDNAEGCHHTNYCACC